MTPEIKRMLDHLGAAPIVIPFLHQACLRGFIPLCDDRGFCMAVHRDYYVPDPAKPGTCVQ